jgi:hypothetical protein
LERLNRKRWNWDINCGRLVRKDSAIDAIEIWICMNMPEPNMFLKKWRSGIAPIASVHVRRKHDRMRVRDR